MQLRNYLTRNLATAAILALALTTQIPAQTPSPRPQVEVAVIRLSPPGGGDNGNIHITPGRIEAHNMTVRQLIHVAYKIKADHILGGPHWLDSDPYDITAAVQDMSGDNFTLTLQTLLEDRFKLKFHPDIREGNVYDLTVAKGGLKMQPTKPGSCVPLDLSRTRPPQTDQRRCASWTGTRPGYRNAIGVSMADTAGVGFQSLTGQLSLILDKPVIDKTELTGLFDVHLEWTPDEVDAPNPADSGLPASTDIAPSIFTAVREQLGLELKPAKGPITFLVIDSVDRPSDN